jgi:hypothetical protein
MILNNKSTYEAIGELKSAHCKPVGNDEGKRFTSMTDAAKYAGVSVQNMCKHLSPNGSRTCKGHVYFYIDKRDESFDTIMSRLSEMSAEAERRKADEDDARKWREYQAEQERIRKAEEKRIEDERKAKEKYEADVQKAKARLARRTEICERLASELARAEQRKMEAEIELETLLDNNQQEVA